MYAAEVSSSKFRGVFGSLVQLFLPISLVLIYLLGSFPGFQYFDISLILISIIAVFDIGCLFICDTPRWLLAHGHRHEAISALKCLKGKSLTLDMSYQQWNSISIRIPTSRCQKFKLELFRGEGCCHTPGNHAFYYVLSADVSTSYSGLIFKEAGVENCRATATYAVGGTEVVFKIISLFIEDILPPGSKLLLIISGIGIRPSLCTSLAIQPSLTWSYNPVQAQTIQSCALLSLHLSHCQPHTIQRSLFHRLGSHAISATWGADSPTSEGSGEWDSYTDQLVHCCHRDWFLSRLCGEGTAMVCMVDVFYTTWQLSYV